MEKRFWSESESLPIEKDLESLFQDAVNRGYKPYIDDTGLSGSFGVSNDGSTRDTFFIFRGHGPVGETRCPLLEVRLYEGDHLVQLGPIFGYEESTCVVIAGYSSAQTVWNSWLEGSDISFVLNSVTFFNRMDMTRLAREV